MSETNNCQQDSVKSGLFLVGICALVTSPLVMVLGFRELVISKLDTQVQSLTQSQTPHTETFGAEAEQRRYIDVVVEGKPVKAYFEINGQPAQDYINQRR